MNLVDYAAVEIDRADHYRLLQAFPPPDGVRAFDAL